MKGNLRVGRFFGIDVKLHLSWWFIALLLTWVLATNFFPTFYPELSQMNHWLVAIISAILLFVSVLLHEFSHSLVARLKGIHVHSITLFFFGGVADIESESMKPLDEFLMAIAGPLFSFLLAGIFAITYQLTEANLIINAISFYLFQLNLVLGIFNLVPGYPLDGGRAFRAILHWYYKDLRKATRIASFGGKAFALLLIVLGFAQIFTGAFAGVWLILIGFFLHFIAGLSYEQVIFYDVLSKWNVSQFQVRAKASVMVKGDTLLKEFIQTHLADKHKVFIVKKGSQPSALLDLTAIQALRGENLEKISVHGAAIPLKKLGTLTPNQTAYVAFKKFLETGSRVLSVKKTMDSPTIEGLVFKEQVMNALVRRLKFGVNFKDVDKGKVKIKLTKKRSKSTMGKAKSVQAASGKETKGNRRTKKQKGAKKKSSKKVVKKKTAKKTRNTKKTITNAFSKKGSLPLPKLPS